MKISVFWDVTTSCYVGRPLYERFHEACLRVAVFYLPNCTESHLRRQQSIFSHFLYPEMRAFVLSVPPTDSVLSQLNVFSFISACLWSILKFFSRISEQICYILLAAHEIKFYPHFLCKSTSPVKSLCTGCSTHSTLLHLTTLRMRNIFAIQALHRKL